MLTPEICAVGADAWQADYERDLFIATCAAFALVSLVGIVRTGPIWSKIVAAILALPPLLLLVLIIDDALHRGWLVMIIKHALRSG